ncbi:hypothetical protein [Thalassovita aquimarina]|uniref:Uncharacterized protein n=1 Tax=Thalassovita aquimarina TaxID=2785917 RepID=A0ABS5HT59_9RHOB|nr:hypothetical protein [Thalassovita aquimarina]MBR9651967.1 hypothetical protein [Thalassovita aquimarina]
MHLFPNIKAKKFSECEHGELVSIQVRGEIHSALCVADEDGKKELLLLDNPTPDRNFMLVTELPDTIVKSYGTDWLLSTSSPMESPSQALSERGAIAHSTEGLFIVCSYSSQGFIDPAVCRLDRPGIRVDTGFPKISFADTAWEISIYDPTTRSSVTLASKAQPAP